MPDTVNISAGLNKEPGTSTMHQLSVWQRITLRIKAYRISRSIKKGMNEVSLIKAGKIKENTLDHFLNEL